LYFGDDREHRKSRNINQFSYGLKALGEVSYQSLSKNLRECLDLHFLLLLGLIDSGGAMNAFITDTLIAVRGLTHDLKLRT